MLKLLNYTIVARRMKARFDKWAQARRGAVAVEFGLIAVPFFFLIFGLLEVSMIFIVSIILENASSEASRLIRTGQLQNGSIGEVGFKNLVCDELYSMLDCGADLTIDVKTFDSFGGATDPSPIDENGDFDSSSFTFQPGASNEIVVVRVFYEWSLFTPVLTAPLANLNDGKILIQSTVAFRNEPFGE